MALIKILLQGQKSDDVKEIQRFSLKESKRQLGFC